MLSGQLDCFRLYEFLPFHIQEKIQFSSTFLAGVSKQCSFPYVFLHFCCVNIVFHHPFASILIRTIYILAGTNDVNRAGQIKIKAVWE